MTGLLRRQKNTWKLVAMKLLSSCMLIIPVIALFYSDHGLSLTQIGLLQSIFSFALVSLEIPTGYISDRWGRKASLITGYGTIVLGYIVYRQGSTFFQFAVAEIILALGRACNSGSDSALLYDTLKQGGKAHLAKKREGRINFASALAGVMGGILGGYIGHVRGYPILWLLGAGLVGIGWLLALFLEEIRSPEHHTQSYHVLADVKKLVHTYQTQPRLLWLVLFTGVIAYATYSLVWVQQQRLAALGAPVARFGVFRGIAKGSIAGGGLLSHRYDDHFGHRASMGGLLIGILLGFALMAVGIHWALALLGLCIAFLVRGLQQPLTTFYVNEQTSSALRATTLSSMSMVHRFFFATLLPLQGWLSDALGMQMMFVCMLGFFAIVGGRCLRQLMQASRPEA